MTSPAIPIAVRRLVRIGPGARLDPACRVGETPGRNIPFLKLDIGADARIRMGAVIYLGSRIGRHFETGHNAVVREENFLGDGVSVWNHTTIDYGCVIGRNVKIHSSCYVGQYTVIEDGVFIAPGTTLLNDPHPGCACSKQCMRGPHVGKGAAIGGGCVILPMVRIGAGALIGAGSVVTRDVPPGAVVAGVPARSRGPKARLKCWTGHTLRPYPAPRTGSR